MKLSDYVMDYLAVQGTDAIFTVTGGGIMHLVDSLGRSESIRYICNYHEQACAIAAESYARATGRPGVLLVTTGPGSTNALSAIAGAWVDSVPVVVISGQVRRDLIADYSRVRQMGPQEINILDMVRPVTKYAVTITDPATIGAELDKAFDIASRGRPGPVWINIPLDVQGAQIDLPAPCKLTRAESIAPVVQDVARVVELLSKASRPALVFGNGVHYAGAECDARALADRLGIPVLTTLGGLDLIGDDHPLFAGRFGPGGQRNANFVIQTCDLLLTIGASMSVTNIGFNTDSFSPHSTKIVVNSDVEEIRKMRPTPHLGVTADAGSFIRALHEACVSRKFDLDADWPVACREWKQRYPTVTPEQRAEREYVNSYVFVDRLSECLSAGDLVLTGNALDAVSVIQAFKVTLGQRVYTNINYGAMGWDLPAAVGAAVARLSDPAARTILVTGDGSIQFNIQELMTIGLNRLNIKIFVLNNDGYQSIRATQTNHFAGHLVGADSSSGVGNPRFDSLATAYGLGYCRIENHAEMDARLAACLAEPGPMICELNVSPTQPRSPRLMSRRAEDGRMESPALEDMYPFLPKEEIQRNLQRFASAAVRTLA
ncbi:acetolactate synthase-1/2/3 large subunit [Paraburkholderia sp. GAS333]|uniref:thiamine pyrophosphate-binding protein n=1 Tax=Paraburkholderia sp. GAS333 TaxID=3156279 RepID=UPI003D1C31C2